MARFAPNRTLRPQHNELLAAKPAATSKVEEQRLRLSSLAAEGAAAERDVGVVARHRIADCSAFVHSVTAHLGCRLAP
jgi:hypothetical protein